MAAAKRKAGRPVGSGGEGLTATPQSQRKTLREQAEVIVSLADEVERLNVGLEAQPQSSAIERRVISNARRILAFGEAE